jgi:ABC-type branched-subunit amino acid transport system ATPase component/ABC-type branched-subunit amino acid transport system permease subunit
MSLSRVVSIIAIVAVFVWSLNVGDVKQSVLVGVIAVAIAALGLDLLVARTGELSLAHAAFLGIGAFTAINAGSRGCAWPVSMVLAIVVTAAAATIAGLPSLRIHGLQVAITTLAFQEFAEVYLFSRQDVTAAGRSIDRPPFLRSDLRLYLFAVAALVLVLVVRQRIGVTKSGRQFLAVRDLGDRARSFGIEPGPTKLYAYALSGAIVGLGGAVLALKAGSISAKDPFLLLESLTLVAIVVVGGSGSAAGIITAAVAIKALPQFSSTIPLTNVAADRVVPIASAALLVFVIVVAPRGIGGLYSLIGRALDARPKPDPRPHPTDLEATAHHAVVLRDVARPLWLRMPVPALLEAEDVHVDYGGVAALAGISLEVRRGEIVGLIGANGAGKSTFFNAVSGFAPTEGSIRYRGVELVGRPATNRSRFGVARTFQDLGLVRAETVGQNVLLAQTWLARYPLSAGILGLGPTVPTERELRRRAGLALELFGLDHLARERLGELPYGTMRTVEIASAVAAGPDILLLDEATAGLDPHASHELGDRFLALRGELGITLVIVEHHVPLVARVCDYVYCLDSGTLIAEGAPGEVTDNPDVIASFLGRGHATGTSAG